MAEPKTFPPVKFICGIISSEDRFFKKAEELHELCSPHISGNAQ